MVLGQQTSQMRAVLVNENVPGNQAHVLWVQCGGEVLQVAVRSVSLARMPQRELAGPA